MSLRSAARNVYRSIPARSRLYLDFIRFNRYWPSLTNPVTFNEKIQVRKSEWKNPLFVTCSDKSAVKNYVARQNTGATLIPSLYECEKLSADDLIGLAAEHGPVVVKTTHGSGSNYFLSATEGQAKAKEILARINFDMNEDFGRRSGEGWYSEIPPRIIVEPNISQRGEDLRDFKFHVFNSISQDPAKIVIQVDFDRHTRHARSFYDISGGIMNFTVRYPAGPATQLEEAGLSNDKASEMISIATSLAQPFSYARVDLYYVRSKILFGELTFAHESGFGRFNPQWRDRWMGGLWTGDPCA